MADDKIQGVPEGLTEEPVANTTGIQGVPEGLSEEPLHMGGAGGSWEPQSKASKVWEAVNTPMIPEGRAEKEGHQVAESAPTLSESEHPYLTGAKKGLAGAYADTMETVRGLSSPLGVATMGLGTLGEAVGKISAPLGKAIKYGSRAAGLGFGAQGLEQGYEGAKDISEHGVTPENIKQTTQGTGFGLLGAAGSLHGTEAGEAPAQKTLAAPIRGAAKLAKPASHLIPAIGGITVATELGLPHPWLIGGALGRFVLPPELLENFFAKGRTLGLNEDEANITLLRDRYNEALKDAKGPEQAYKAHGAGRQQGIPAPEDVLKAHEKAQTELQSAKDHLLAAQQDYADKVSGKAAVGPEQPIALSEDQQAAQTARVPKAPPEPAPAPVEQAPAPVEAPAAPAPAPVETATRPLAPPVPATAAEMSGLKAVGGKVVEAPEKAVGPLVKEGLQRGSETGRPAAITPLGRVPGAAPIAEAPKPEVKAEAPKAEREKAPFTEPGLLGTEKELKNEGRSPEDLTKVDTVIKELPNQDLIRHGSKFGVDESKYDFSKRVALREGGSKHPVEREAHANATVNALPEALRNHIVDAANDWDTKNPKIFDPASYTNTSRAERARAIMNEATKRYEAEQGKGAAKQYKDMTPAEKEEFTAKTTVAGGAHNEHEEAVKAGGGEYKGVQEGVPEANLKGLVLFDHPETHSTLALPEDQVTPEAVKAKLEDHKEAWDKAKKAQEDLKATEKPEPKGVHTPGEPESDLEMARRGADIPVKQYKDMTSEEKEEFAKNTPVSGGAPRKATAKAKELPTGDALIRKYGESSGDPANTTFILEDGRGVANTGVDHDIMLGGKTTDAQPPREQFVQEGNIRVRPRQGTIGGREVSISIPPKGVNVAQLEYIKKMSPQLRSGAVLIENGERGGDYKVIEYGKATNEVLESAINDLGPKGNRLDKQIVDAHNEGGSFNPERFRTQTGEDTELRPLGKKRSPLGKATR